MHHLTQKSFILFIKSQYVNKSTVLFDQIAAIAHSCHVVVLLAAHTKLSDSAFSYSKLLTSHNSPQI